MNRHNPSLSINPTSAMRAKPRLIAGACCLLIAIVLSKARRGHDLTVRTTVELRLSDQWSLC